MNRNGVPRKLVQSLCAAVGAMCLILGIATQGHAQDRTGTEKGLNGKERQELDSKRDAILLKDLHRVRATLDIVRYHGQISRWDPVFCRVAVHSVDRRHFVIGNSPSRDTNSLMLQLYCRNLCFDVPSENVGCFGFPDVTEVPDGQDYVVYEIVHIPAAVADGQFQIEGSLGIQWQLKLVGPFSLSTNREFSGFRERSDESNINGVTESAVVGPLHQRWRDADSGRKGRPYDLRRVPDLSNFGFRLMLPPENDLELFQQLEATLEPGGLRDSVIAVRLLRAARQADNPMALKGIQEELYLWAKNLVDIERECLVESVLGWAEACTQVSVIRAVGPLYEFVADDVRHRHKQRLEWRDRLESRVPGATKKLF